MLIHQFIIKGDNCNPYINIQNDHILIDYEKCDIDAVIRIKACVTNAMCIASPAHLHCDCNTARGSVSTNCEEINPLFINGGIISNKRWCPPGYFVNPRKFYIDLGCHRTTGSFSVVICTVHKKCFNKPNKHHCTCANPYLPTRIITKRTSIVCRDINECLSNPCNPWENCTNTPGSFTCTNSTCIDVNYFNNSQCSFIHWDKQAQLPWFSSHQYCSVINSLVILVNKQCQNKNDDLLIQKVISTGSDLLEKDSMWGELEIDKRLYLASVFLQTVENAVVGATLSLQDQESSIELTNIGVEILNLRGLNSSASDIISLQTKGNAVDIDRNTITRNQTDDVAAVALIAYSNMDSILKGCPFKLSTSGGNQTSFQLASNVVSAVMTNRENHDPKTMLNFTFRQTEQPDDGWSVQCAHWNYAPEESYWTPDGCSLQDSNGTHTRCQCNQVSNLALLIAPFKWKGEPYALTVITDVGIPVSLVCLIVTIGTIVLWEELKSAIIITHMQLCVSLFLAELLFIIGINKTGHRIVCGVIAGFLHYLFLSAFVWMFLEGIQLYLLVRNIKNLRISKSEKMGKYMYGCGYGIPAVIVVVSAAIYPDGYGSPNYCWLQKQRRFNWSFLGPVCLIIWINTFLFLITLWNLKKEIDKRDIEVSKLKDTRMLTFKAIGRVFILGCSWIFGLFHFDEETIVMAYLFTIVNSFQGFFIFIILCVLNPKVVTQCKRLFSVMCRNKKIVSPKDAATIIHQLR
ncbi:adhesion G protein-coupled receptor E3-like [Leucoraja erinacea]|uniref:adhesion G protein-coupled receptor E3-like n=1 Tax=Leucoraja erinaceus TaxID=7782 RepID=UPI002456F577|nr:adhesion G protein-coupled receptor E3-like [Leucoraja erinacea]